MTNLLKTLPVGKIIQNENTPNRNPNFEHYLIPYYQRGYRWDEINVKALLEDIDNFINLDEGKYCLQPIVVVPRIDDEGKNIWEVVDGQQRLITMFIIFKCINKRKYKIIFEKRELSTSFLENLSEDTYSDDNPDFHFMSQAHRLIKEFFDNKMRHDVGYEDDFYARLTKKVEVIWYQIEELRRLENETDTKKIEDKKIDIFNRLNIGKIPLTDAELIRALLLSKIKTELSDREAIMRQAEISNEWHEIEIALRNQEFWGFLNTKPIEEVSSAIELIFKLIAGEDSKNYSTYLWFEKQIKSDNPLQEKKNAEELWTKTKQIFYKFKFWFETNTLYHHLGFLLINDDKSMSKLKKIIENSETSKSKFIEWAVTEVKEEMSDIVLEELSYESGTRNLEKTFLLFNVLSTDKLSSTQNNRFPFFQYKKIARKDKWSIEHIHAQQSKEMKEKEAMKKWLEDTYKAIEHIQNFERIVTKKDDNNEYYEEIEKVEVSEDIKLKMLEMINSDNIIPENFNLLKSQLTTMFDSESVHVLDNLALLSRKHNSSLNNAIFPVKRNRIIELQKEGKYVPLTTMNVFLKYYSKSDLQPFYWSKADKENYFNEIKSTLQPYLK
jgi:uncharacterized protein with ParB-like and HNH nuclease domain